MSRHLKAEQLSTYLDDEVGSDEARRIERHLDDCGECRDRLEGLRRVVGGLRSLEAAAPPKNLGLELQRQLARATPPFGDRSPVGRHASRRVLQPLVLASLGVVLALAIITLLFLQALQRRGDGSGTETGKPAESSVEAVEVIISGRIFRQSAGGWVEASLTRADIAGARDLVRGEAVANDPSGVLGRVADELSGAVTLRFGDEIVRLSAD